MEVTPVKVSRAMEFPVTQTQVVDIRAELLALLIETTQTLIMAPIETEMFQILIHVTELVTARAQEITLWWAIENLNRGTTHMAKGTQRVADLVRTVADRIDMGRATMKRATRKTYPVTGRSLIWTKAHLL